MFLDNQDASGAASSTTEYALPEGAVIGLGTRGTVAVLYSEATKSVHRLAPSAMTELNLKAVCGADWCERHYNVFNPTRGEMMFDYRRLATDILRECQAKGPYSESCERRAGVWPVGDGSKLMVNGRVLWMSDGTVLEHGLHDGRIYSARGDLGFGPATAPATEDDVALVLKAFNAIEWRNALGAELLLGFIGVATCSAAMARRPHLMATGGAGVGKSTLLDQMGGLLGLRAYRATGPQTLAAYYQELGGTTRAVVLDEFEADVGRRSCKDTFEIARMSYSLQEGDKGIVRGTPSGVTHSYRFTAPFIAAAISPGKMEPADVTRWVVLEAVSRKPDAARLTEVQARGIGPRLARLFIDRWSVFRASEELVRARIIAAGGDSRMADTVGTLLAAYWAFVSEQPATASDVDVLVGMLDIEARIRLHEDRDEDRCLEALLSKVLPFQYMEGQYLVRQSLSIGQAIARFCENPGGGPDLAYRLAQLGIRVTRVKGVWQMFVANSPEHQELRKVFAGTKWAHGGWSTMLRRLPGGHESTQRLSLGAGTKASKVTVFDVPAELSPADEDEERLAA